MTRFKLLRALGASLSFALLAVVASSCSGKSTSSSAATAGTGGLGNGAAAGAKASGGSPAHGGATTGADAGAPDDASPVAGAGQGGEPQAPLCVDPASCGECGACVAAPDQVGFTLGYRCENKQCVAQCYEGTQDCDDQLGCESFVNTAEHCGQCGRKTCAAKNTLLTCDAGGNACTNPVCAPGFANCVLASPDCETPLGGAANCFPTYLDTIKYHTRSVFPVVAIAPDGSTYLGGDLNDTQDFDPTSGVDTPSTGSSGMAYITKLDPDGSYAWTRTFNARFMLLYGLAADANGVVAVGTYADTVDFDPGPEVAPMTATTFDNGDSFLVKLAPNGDYAWARSWSPDDGAGHVSVASVAVRNGEVYVVGAYAGTVDFDPGTPRNLLSNTGNEQAFVTKLGAYGSFEWVRGVSGGSGCQGYAFAVSAGAQGPVWVAGIRQGRCTFSDKPPSNDGGGHVAAFQANGELVGEWSVGQFGSDLRSISAADDGSAFVGGYLHVPNDADIDLDPGPSVDKRGVVPGNTGFVMKLAADGGYAWSQLLGLSNVAVAATPDGGVLTTGVAPATPPADDTKRVVSKLRADGSSAWSLGYFPAVSLVLAAGKNRFVVGGVVDHGDLVDFNPFAPTESSFAGQLTFFTRYSY